MAGCADAERRAARAVRLGDKSCAARKRLSVVLEALELEGPAPAQCRPGRPRKRARRADLASWAFLRVSGRGCSAVPPGGVRSDHPPFWQPGKISSFVTSCNLQWKDAVTPRRNPLRTFSMTPELLAGLDQLRARDGISRSTAVQIAVRDLLQRKGILGKEETPKKHAVGKPRAGRRRAQTRRRP